MNELRKILDERMAGAFTRAFDSAELLAGVAKMAAATATPPQEFYKNSIAIRMSEEDAIAYGMIPDPRPTDVIEAERAELDRKHAERVAETTLYVTAMDAITEPVSRLVLDLHSRSSGNYPTCTGCDFSGYEGEPPDWPCTTVEEVGRHHGIEPPRWATFDKR